MLRPARAKHPIAGLVGRIPEQRIGQRIADEGAENGGDDAAANDPGDQRRHHHMRAEKRGQRGEHADREAERNGMRRGTQAAQAIEHVPA